MLPRNLLYNSNKARRLHSLATDSVPFSYTLLFIAVLHFSVWSLGVCEAPARDFYTREIANCKSIDIYYNNSTQLINTNLYSLASLYRDITLSALYSIHTKFTRYQQLQLQYYITLCIDSELNQCNNQKSDQQLIYNQQLIHCLPGVISSETQSDTDLPTLY